MIRPGGRGQWFVLAMFQRAKMRQSEQYELIKFFGKIYHDIMIKNRKYLPMKGVYLYIYIYKSIFCLVYFRSVKIT